MLFRSITEDVVQSTDTSKPKPVVTIKLEESDKPKFVSDLIAADKSIPEYGGGITIL